MRFNRTVTSDPNINHEGSRSYKLDPYTELYSLVCTCLVNEPRFYGKTGTIENRIVELVDKISKVDPEFVLRLAHYVRTKMNLRTISTVLLVESALQNKGQAKPYVTQWTPHIINRVDEISEAISYLKNKIGNIGDQTPQTSIPISLKKGLANSFEKFNEYQFGKYKGQSKDVSLRDSIRLIHPKPHTQTQETLYKAIATNTLPIPETWETYISINGSNKENWEHILPQMPIFAILRNLRNFLKFRVSNLDIALNKLTNPEVITKSRILPFRFYTAYKFLADTGLDPFDTKKVLNALDKAMELATSNISIGGRTAVFIDDSGSMDNLISSKSSIRHNELGYIIAAMLNKKNPTNYTLVFGTNCLPYNFDNSSVLANIRSLANFAEKNEDYIDHGTDTWKCIQNLIENKIDVDRIIVISDCQSYNSGGGSESVESLLTQYKKDFGNCFVYSFNTNSYGDSDINHHNPNTLLISGWSDNIFNYIPRFEESGQTVVNEIKNIQLPTFRQKEED